MDIERLLSVVQRDIMRFLEIWNRSECHLNIWCRNALVLKPRFITHGERQIRNHKHTFHISVSTYMLKSPFLLEIDFMFMKLHEVFPINTNTSCHWEDTVLLPKLKFHNRILYDWFMSYYYSLSLFIFMQAHKILPVHIFEILWLGKWYL